MKHKNVCLLNYLWVDFNLQKIFTLYLFTKKYEEHSVSEEQAYCKFSLTYNVSKKSHFQTKFSKMTKFTFDPYLDCTVRHCSFSCLLINFVRSVLQQHRYHLELKVDVSEDCSPFETKYTKLCYLQYVNCQSLNDRLFVCQTGMYTSCKSDLVQSLISSENIQLCGNHKTLTLNKLAQPCKQEKQLSTFTSHLPVKKLSIIKHTHVQKLYPAKEK